MSYQLVAVTDLSAERPWLSEGGMQWIRQALSASHLLDERMPKPSAPPVGDAATLLAWRSQRAPNPSTVPAWKFASAEGWRVTPGECQLLAQSLSEQDDALITSFKRFCARCVSQGGFQVWW